jgi:hypothetical protein
MPPILCGALAALRRYFNLNHKSEFESMIKAGQKARLLHKRSIRASSQSGFAAARFWLPYLAFGHF